MDAFTKAYLKWAIFTSVNEDGHPLDKYYSISDFAPEAIEEAEEDCRIFQEIHAADIQGRNEQAGYDFWLTRNHHGAGFWDGDWPDDAGKRLTEDSHTWGSVDVYVGDDDLLYFQ